MIDKKPQNPPAFPINVGGIDEGFCNSGMSLRDYFAAAALQGLCSNDKSLKENAKYWNDLAPERPEFPREGLALFCYQFADAMLKEREK